MDVWIWLGAGVLVGLWFGGSGSAAQPEHKKRGGGGNWWKLVALVLGVSLFLGRDGEDCD